MWLGELITERGIGNGMSLLIFTSIVARMPQNLLSIAKGNGGVSKFLIVIAVILASTVAVVFIEQATRRIPVQYAKRMIGRRQYGGSTTYIPVKINTAGVIPVIFASSILSMPQLVAQFGKPDSSWVQWIGKNLHQTAPPLSRRLRAPHPLLHLLLHGDHLQPRGDRGQYEEVRRIHSRHPGR